MVNNYPSWNKLPTLRKRTYTQSIVGPLCHALSVPVSNQRLRLHSATAVTGIKAEAEAEAQAGGKAKAAAKAQKSQGNALNTSKRIKNVTTCMKSYILHCCIIIKQKTCVESIIITKNNKKTTCKSRLWFLICACTF